MRTASHLLSPSLYSNCGPFLNKDDHVSIYQVLDPIIHCYCYYHFFYSDKKKGFSESYLLKIVYHFKKGLCSEAIILFGNILARVIFEISAKFRETRKFLHL